MGFPRTGPGGLESAVHREQSYPLEGAQPQQSCTTESLIGEGGCDTSRTWTYRGNHLIKLSFDNFCKTRNLHRGCHSPVPMKRGPSTDYPIGSEDQQRCPTIPVTLVRLIILPFSPQRVEIVMRGQIVLGPCDAITAPADTERGGGG